ncbi:MAG: hypothetical protein HC858_01605 [Brachymonas sp.]|nr:hypothetical protein [Brachymonas sp.]
MIPSDFKDFLLSHGADERAHSGLTLWSHLSGVHRILEAAKLPEYVCIAGLFHSVYGTRSFQPVTIEKTKRNEVAALIGNRAEAIAFAFCELPRPNLFEFALRNARAPTPTEIDRYSNGELSDRFYQDLLAIECANLGEQRQIHEFPSLARHAQKLGILDAEGFCI